MKEFRFGVSRRNFDDRPEWVDKCRHAERLGYDVLTIPDHLGHLAPFPALASAAAATERVRVGTMVLNTAFYHPALLARDVETTVRACGGRLDLGLGAGAVKAEFDEAGLPWRSAPQRIAHVARTVEQLRRLLGEMPPLLIAGNSDGMLALAAEQADIAGFAGLKQVPGHPAGTFDIATADELDERGSSRAPSTRSPGACSTTEGVSVSATSRSSSPRWQPSPRSSRRCVPPDDAVPSASGPPAGMAAAHARRTPIPPTAAGTKAIA